MRIHHLALRVADVERSLSFYSGVLGLGQIRRQVDQGLRSVWLKAGETILMLEGRLAGAGANAGSGHLLAFAVDDLAGWQDRLAAAGIAIEGRTEHTLYVLDPDGHRVGLSDFESDPTV